MLRCRQAGQFTSQSRRKTLHGLQFSDQNRPASTTTSSPRTAPSTTFRFPSQTSPSPSPSSLPRGTYRPTSRRPTQVRTAQPLNLWTAIKSIFGWKPTPAPYTPAPFTATTNPYRARKTWPPDFTTLHPKHQFHFEKTYRRRAKLKYARPRWTKGTKIVQFALTVLIVGYWVFFLEVEGEGGTFWDAFRKMTSHAWNDFGKLPESNRQQMGTLSQAKLEQESAGAE
ncbi:hypothetical protein EPUS_03736 [Endocarpon pusillum Z07020]|uniref:Uncharacterized protein n=1 Tax=Endocarpon pusillum (strain Z07020 / HMAS-L-300199) TaxID=1263415 RepID=U1G8V5_ENDPU|nr:uncharacterized protein EPUS_03736 [Endocarpon pusillum Z07020]ERF68418.1 hypothetical protein EPUS_03736 [Endocarpon pusillum Z07020]